MTTVLVTGPEASGNRMLCRMLTEAGATVLHKPMPMSTHWRPGMPATATTWDGEWTHLASLEWDAAVVIQRDWHCTIEAQVQAGHVRNAEHAAERTRRALACIYSQLGMTERPWFVVTFESLARPRAVEALCERLGLDGSAVRTPWLDANAKHYGGPIAGDHRPLWAHPRWNGTPPLLRTDPGFPALRYPNQPEQGCTIQALA